jgi:antitoxin component YwqK of YwqJK toxin-antitoxin module
MKNFIIILFALCSLSIFSQTKHENGPYKEYYDNGILKKEGLYKNDIKIGVWKNYYDTGQLKKIYTFSNDGQSSGIEENYSKNGNLISETKPSKNGGLIYKRFYDNGNLLLAYNLIPSENKKYFIKNGGYKEYYEDGALKIEGLYTDNELTFVWKQYYITGEKEWEVGYLNGYKQGTYKQFYKNGNLKVDGFHDLDLKSGDEKRYDSIGNLINTLKYKNGNLKKAINTANLEAVIVPDGVIERVPMYPGCESLLGNEAKKNCMAKEISSFVMSKFNTTFGKDLGLSGKQNIYVIFKIDKTGHVIDIQARAKHKALEAEAIRVIALLPKMTPGFQFGKPVIVPYSMPIIFVL